MPFPANRQTRTVNGLHQLESHLDRRDPSLCNAARVYPDEFFEAENWEELHEAMSMFPCQLLCKVLAHLQKNFQYEASCDARVVKGPLGGYYTTGTLKVITKKNVELYVSLNCNPSRPYVVWIKSSGDPEKLNFTPKNGGKKSQ